MFYNPSPFVVTSYSNNLVPKSIPITIISAISGWIFAPLSFTLIIGYFQWFLLLKTIVFTECWSKLLRQEGDLKLVETLKRVRTASLTADDLTILSSLQVLENDTSLPIGATRIFYTYAEVDRDNEYKLNCLHGQVFSSKTVIKSPVGCRRPKINQGKINDTAFSDLITLKVGARVMLIYNVDVNDSLTNGQLRSIVGIIFPEFCQIICVLVKIDDEHVGISLIKQYPQFQSSYSRGVPIFKTFVTYQLCGRNCHTARSQLLQLHLRLAWALTCHKVQGQSFPTCQKDIIKWDQSLQPRMAYVMLSRAKRLCDLWILGQCFPRQIRCSEQGG